MEEITTPAIEVTDTPVEAEAPVVFPTEGEVIVTPAGEPDEVIVIDRDENGAEIGWHKEPVNG